MSYPYNINNNDHNAAVGYNNDGYADYGNNDNKFQEQQFQQAQVVYENNRYPPIDNRPSNYKNNLGPEYSQKPELLQNYNNASTNYSSPPLEVYPPSSGKQPYQERQQQGIPDPSIPTFGQQEMQSQYSTQQQFSPYDPNYPNYPNYNNYNSPMQTPLYNYQMQTPPTSYGHDLPPVPPSNYNQISKPGYSPSSNNLNQTQPYSYSKDPYHQINYSQPQNTTYTSNDPRPPKINSPPLNLSNKPRPPENYSPPQTTENASYTSNDPRPPKNYSPPLNTTYTSNDSRPPKSSTPPQITENSPRPPKNYSPAPNTSSQNNDSHTPDNYSPTQVGMDATTYVGGNKKERISQKNDNCCPEISICGCIRCTCTLFVLIIGVIFIIIGVGMYIYSRTLPSACGSPCDPSQITNSTNSTTSAIPGNVTDTVNQTANDGGAQCKLICQKIIYNVLQWGGIGCFGLGVLIVLIQVLKMLCRLGKGGSSCCFCC
ncbi:3815_t:CDS:1 [Scutellospora calospora]|uniref:3815_t:CDS:1 n=1 Tax=Scutellospora calospora TaxID=85575 RepID=A0ACA9KLX7_9GLOM|nr:3815_t:CDS:1 [Scutellospora calospora]